MLDTVNGMKQFIMLQKKSLSELQAIAEGFGLEIHNDKELLIRELVGQDRPTQKDLQGNTLLAITLPNEESRNLMLKWRKNIYEQGKYQKYTFSNAKGEEYSQNFKRILLSEDSVRTILRLGMVLPKDYTKDVFEALCNNPANFIVSLVLKKENNNSWLMVLLEPKRKAA